MRPHAELCGSASSARLPVGDNFALFNILTAAFTSACSAEPQDTQTKTACAHRLAASTQPHLEHVCDVWWAFTNTTCRPASAALSTTIFVNCDQPVRHGLPGAIRCRRRDRRSAERSSSRAAGAAAPFANAQRARRAQRVWPDNRPRRLLNPRSIMIARDSYANLGTSA